MNKLIPLLAFSALLLVPVVALDAFAQSTLYGIAGSGPSTPSTFYEIDQTNGVGTPIGLVGFNSCDSMDINQNGKIYATCDRAGTDINVLVTINPLSGAGTEVGPTGVDISGAFSGGALGMSFRSDGTLFGYRWDCAEFGFNLMTFDLISGLATPIGSTNTCSGGNGLAFTPGDILKVFLSTPVISDVNQLDGTLSNTVVSPTMQSSPAMDYNPADGLLYAVDNPSFSSFRELVILNPVDGQITFVGQTVDRLTGIAFLPDRVVGGESLSVDSTALILAGAQSFSWMIPVVLSGIGIGLFVVSRKIDL